MQQHTITYTGYTIGDKVWVWAYWIPLVAEVEIIGIELNRYPEDPDLHIYYRTKVQAPNGDVDQHSYSLDELYATKKEALEAAIKEQTAEVSEWRDDLGEAETTLGNLKQQLLEECLLEDAAK